MKTKIPLMFHFFLVCCIFAQQEEFVTVNGRHFFRNGRPYYFLGANFWYGCMLGREGENGDRRRLCKELDLLHSLSIDNLRIMGASEGMGEQYQISPAIQPMPGVFDESLLIGLDFLLAEMAKRQMVAVIFLNNYWEWTGGMSQYMSWSTGEPYPNPHDPRFTYWDLMKTSGLFYQNTKANEYYRHFLSTLINRRNSINGRLYKEDPTIMAWQLANEPRPYPEEPDRERHIAAFIRWIDETAAFIKSLDPHHLVCTGNEGLAGCLWSESCYLQAHQSKNIDYLTAHLWPLNWDWYNPLKAEETYPQAEAKALEYVRQHINYAQQLGKPLTLEEFGLPRDGHQYSPASPTTYRDRFLKVLYEEMYQSAKKGSAFAGSNFWGWGGFGRARDQEKFIWQPGDDYTGDPPQEPQGRNSIFASDKSTLKILKKYAKLMKSLEKIKQSRK